MILDILHWHPLLHHNNPLYCNRRSLRTRHWIFFFFNSFLLRQGNFGLHSFASLCPIVWSQSFHLLSSLSELETPLKLFFCRVVLLFSVELLSARDNCLLQMSVVPFIVWHTPRNGSGTLQRPCRWTWRGTAGTVAPTGPGSCSSQGLALLLLLLQLQAVSASQLWSSVEVLKSPYVALRRSCVLCAHDTWEPLLCSLCLLPAEVTYVHC